MRYVGPNKQQVIAVQLTYPISKSFLDLCPGFMSIPTVEPIANGIVVYFAGSIEHRLPIKQGQWLVKTGITTFVVVDDFAFKSTYTSL